MDRQEQQEQQEQLISAYLDGEVTAEQQARVEKLLEQSPECRQLHDELRTLRVTLQSLPRHKLEEDFQHKVLRQAERRMLTTPSEPATESVTEPTVRLRPFGSMRSFAWAAAAVAAALAIMIFLPERQDNNGVAKKPDQPVADKIKEPPDKTTKPELMAKGKKDDKEVEGKKNRDEKNGNKLAGLKDSGLLDTKKEAKRIEEDRKVPGEKKGSLADGLGKELFDKPASRQVRNKPQESFGEQIARKGGGKPAPAITSPAKGRSFAVKKKNEAPKNPNQVGTAQSIASLDDILPVQNLNQSADQVVVVQCKISPEAARSGAFQKLLAQYQLKATPETSIAVSGQTSDAESLSSKRARSNAPAAQSEHVERVYVEMSKEQLEAALASLKAQPGIYYSVAVQPATKQPQQQTEALEELSALSRDISSSSDAAGKLREKEKSVPGKSVKRFRQHHVQADKDRQSKPVATVPRPQIQTETARAAIEGQEVQKEKPSKVASKHDEANKTKIYQPDKIGPRKTEKLRVLFVFRLDASLDRAAARALKKAATQPKAEAASETKKAAR